MKRVLETHPGSLSKQPEKETETEIEEKEDQEVQRES